MSQLRTLFIASALPLILLMQRTGFAQQFEGVIETRNATTDERGAPQQFTMTMYVKRDMVRIQNSAVGTSPPSTMIYRGDMRVVWMLDEEGKSYFEIRQNEQPQEVRAPSLPDVKAPEVRKTGKKKQVLGLPCEQITIMDNEQQTEIWATKSLGDLFGTISRVLGAEGTGQEWEDKIMKMGYYPLIASTKMGGKILESQEVTKIEKKHLAQELFELPAGFTKETPDTMK